MDIRAELSQPPQLRMKLEHRRDPNKFAFIIVTTITILKIACSSEIR